MVPEETIPNSTLEAPQLAVLRLESERASSEADGQAIELAFNHDHGPGATHWKAAQPGEQTITVVLEQLHTVEQVIMQVEEREVARTQEIQLAVSTDRGLTYCELVCQEFLLQRRWSDLGSRGLDGPAGTCLACEADH